MSTTINSQSYYSASVNDHTAYPELLGEQSADICVIGGGFTGMASALRLAERGFSVAVVESETIGYGASGRNGGQLIHGLGGAGTLKRQYGKEIDAFINKLRWRGNEIVEENIEKYNIDCDFKRGYMDCAFKDRQVRDLEEELEFQTEHGMGDHFRKVSAEEMGDYIGTKVYKGGLYNDRDGHLHPLNLCRGEAKVAAGLGVQIFEQSLVTHITHGKNPIVHTAKGQVKAKQVIIAGNAYHLLEKKHLGGVVFPAGTYIIATEQLSENMAKSLLPSDAAVCDISNMLDYYRLSADRRMLFGGQCNYSGRNPKDIKAAMLPRMLKVFPELKDSDIEFGWGGMIGIVVNRLPHVGRMGDNVYYAQGYSGHGINQTHIISEILADAITGQMEDFDVFAKAKHFKIRAPRWVGNNMIALGMLYYRMQDLM